jgi:hypothetical protein
MPTYMIFGDLHGRVLPAFALARAWQREHGLILDALLQVGDLGYFPDPGRLDKATKRFAQRDLMELGAQLVIRESPDAETLFSQPDVPGPMWFIAGNHEDHELLSDRYGMAGPERFGLPACTDEDFVADHYGWLRCIVSGRVAAVSGGLSVGGLWGIDDEAPGCRRNVSQWMCIEPRRAKELAMRPMGVLVTHDSPQDAMILDAGSKHISLVIELAKPAFAFFGHYHGAGRIDECDLGPTQAFHLAGLEFRGKGHSAEDRCAGVLRWQDGRGSFEYVEPKWLRSITRHNWATR